MDCIKDLNTDLDQARNSDKIKEWLVSTLLYLSTISPYSFLIRHILSVAFELLCIVYDVYRFLCFLFHELKEKVKEWCVGDQSKYCYWAEIDLDRSLILFSCVIAFIVISFLYIMHWYVI